jgi:hypothetical protein
MAGDSKGKQSKFELVIGAVDKFSGVFTGFNAKIDTVGKKVEAAKRSFAKFGQTSGLVKLSGAVGNVGGALRNVVSEGRSLLDTFSGLAGKAGLLFGAAGGGILALAKGVAAAGDEAAKAARSAGVGMTIWQEYAWAAKLSDVSNEQLTKGFVKLQAAAVDAARGGKTQADVFKSLGISYKTANGEVKNADTLFLELADKVRALRAAGQEAKATNLVSDLLGERVGPQFMSMLDSGREGLLKLREEAHRLNLVLPEKGPYEDFMDSFTRLGGAFRGIGNALGKDLLPFVTKLNTKFTEWVASQREVISGGLKEWIDSIDIDKLWQGFLDAVEGIKSFGRSVQEAVDFLGGWKNIAKWLAVFMGGKFLISIGLAVKEFALLGAALATNPLALYAGAVMAIVGAFYYLGEGIEWLKSIMPDWLRGKLGGENAGIKAGMMDPLGMGMNFGTGEAPEQSDGQSRKKGWFGGTEPMAAPLDMASAARGVLEKRTEHVERNELKIKVESQPGVTATVSGDAGDGVSLQTGQQANYG